MQTLKTSLMDRKKSDFAKLLGISDSYLSQYLSGHRRPGYERMLEIERLTDGEVPVQSWELLQASVNALRERQEDPVQKDNQKASA